MSFLLDALRKSERSGRQRAVPTIHSADPVSREVSEQPDWLPTALLGGAAFIMIAWLGLQQFEIFQGGPGAAERVRQPVVVESARPVAVADAGRAAAPAAATRAPGSQAAGREGAGGPRTPVEQLESSAAPAPSEEARSAATASGSTSAATAGNDPVAAVSGAASVPAAQPAAPPRRNYIDYWELPGNVRSQLPEFKLKVLVYAELSDNRFILVNGSRLREGEELQPGLRVEEIRRDGVIFSYQRYRFLVAS